MAARTDPFTEITHSTVRPRGEAVRFKPATIDENALDALAAVVEFDALGAPSFHKIASVCLGLLEFLAQKNRAYGDSALSPVRIFAKDLSPEAQLLVRIDDKLSRMARGSAAGEDVVADLAGYLVLLLAQRQ